MRGGAPRAALVAAALLLPACAIDGDADEALYREVLDGGMPPTPPPGPGKALDLPTAMRLANARDEALASRGEEYVRAVIERRRAAAAFLPILEISPRWFAREKQGSPDPGRGSLDVPASASFDADPVSDAARMDAAALGAEALRERLLAARDDLLLSVARAHFFVLRAERRAEVLRASLALQDAHVEDARARLAAGTGHPLAIALAESRAAEARADLVQAEAEARNGRTALSFLTGWEVGAAPLDGTLDVPEEPPPLEEMLLDLEEARPEIRAAGRAVDAAAAAVREAAGGWWPSISADLNLFLSRQSEPSDLDWTGLLEVNLPLFSAGEVEADVRRALSLLREAKLRLSRERRLARSEVEAARQTLAASRERVAALRLQSDAARRGLELAEGQWTAGLATWLERLTAQDDLLAADLDLASAEMERRELHLAVLRARGRIAAYAGLAPAAGGGGDAAPR
ncbi:MAG: TolC family protein [Planctomycetes bacterium]|nr:TolC family protein [Planctomycetota bacterium]